jgi:hypothetical protein
MEFIDIGTLGLNPWIDQFINPTATIGSGSAPAWETRSADASALRTAALSDGFMSRANATASASRSVSAATCVAAAAGATIVVIIAAMTAGSLKAPVSLCM